MGLSFHDESSMVQASIKNLRFAIPAIPTSNPTSENGSVDEERRHENSQNQLGDDSDIQLVDR